MILQCIKCGDTLREPQHELIIHSCCGFSMFPKEDIDLFIKAGWIKPFEERCGDCGTLNNNCNCGKDF